MHNFDGKLAREFYATDDISPAFILGKCVLSGGRAYYWQEDSF